MERINELSEKTLFSEGKEKADGKELLEKEIQENPLKEYSETVNDGEGLEEIEKLLKHGLAEEAIGFLEGKDRETEKAKADKLNIEAYEGKTVDIKPKLRIKDREEKAEGFFDLGAVIKGEMDPPEQNGNKEKKKIEKEDKFLEEIFTNFKESVDKEVDSEDYNTHYNLGLAYMEMELYEDAIKEFEKALKDPLIKIGVEKKFLDYCNLLGICFIKTGLFNEAERVLDKGLNTAGYEARDYIPLKISRGIMLENLKNYKEALKIYTDILLIEPGNKKANEKIEEMKNLK